MHPRGRCPRGRRRERRLGLSGPGLGGGTAGGHGALPVGAAGQQPLGERVGAFDVVEGRPLAGVHLQDRGEQLGRQPGPRRDAGDARRQGRRGQEGDARTGRPDRGGRWATDGGAVREAGCRDEARGRHGGAAGRLVGDCLVAAEPVHQGHAPSDTCGPISFNALTSGLLAGSAMSHRRSPARTPSVPRVTPVTHRAVDRVIHMSIIM
ncbi:hypothetical protein BCD49_16915 [Pseudofrankia sp. EUN1h]|nr:hypothetical protein BCD49_16915 [Pseudofrankia sp. EUN1h]